MENETVKHGLQKILVVDDEMDMRFFLSTLVKTAGYEVVVSRNGKEAFITAREVKPALIFMDVMMPEEGGTLLFKHLKTDPVTRDIPVIVLSAVAKNTFFHYLKMLNVGMKELLPYPDAYVEKPPEPDVLISLIDRFLNPLKA